MRDYQARVLRTEAFCFVQGGAESLLRFGLPAFLERLRSGGRQGVEITGLGCRQQPDGKRGGEYKVLHGPRVF